jgi:hypothetical protein
MVTNNCVNAGNETVRTVYQGGGASGPTEFGTLVYPATITANRILYASSNDVVGEIAPANNKLLTTDGSGIPSFTYNLLDGSWTPTLEFGGASTGITYTTQSGHYVEIGPAIYLFMLIVLSSKGSATGNATITGLPVTAGSFAAEMSVPIPEFELTLDANYTQVVFSPNASATTATIYQIGSGQTPISADDTNFTNTSVLSGVAMYTTQD